MTEFARAAAALAAAGWPVHPLRPGSKLPLLERWPDRASSQPEHVTAWWAETPAANVGIATGHRGVFVLDVDTANGKPGAASLAALEAKHGALPATLEARTATGGRHLYFTSAGSIRNSAGKLGDGLDVRGTGGYVVAPPSVTPAGAYQWARLATVAAAPDWLVRLAVAAAPVAANETREPETVEATPELLADLRSALAALDADDRDTWIAAAASLRCLGDAGHALWLDWSKTSAKFQDGDEATFYTVGADHSGPAALFARAAAAGWDNPARARHLAAVFGGVPAAPGSALRPVPVHDVMTATVLPPRFIVHPLIPAGHLTLFGSHGGSGKSILALTIGAHVAAGQPWAGFAVERRPVLYVSLEDAGPIVRYRLRKVIDAYGLDATAVTGGLRILDGAEGSCALMSESGAFGVRQLVETPTLAELRAAVGDAGLIVVDNASDAYDGPENDRRQVRSFIRALASLGYQNGAGVLLLAHIDKAAARFGSNGNSYSGSSAWHNSARSRLALVDERYGKELRQEKLNLGKAAAPVRLAWTDHGVLVPITGDAGASEAQGETDALAVLAAIEAATRDGVNVPTSRTGPATAQRVLENLPDLPAHLRGVRGREDFWSAITDLQRSGRIAVEEFLNDSRHRREKFAVRQCASSAPVYEPAQTREPAQGTCASAPVPAQGYKGIGARIEPAHGTGATDVVEPLP